MKFLPSPILLAAVLAASPASAHDYGPMEHCKSAKTVSACKASLVFYMNAAEGSAKAHHGDELCANLLSVMVSSGIAGVAGNDQQMVLDSVTVADTVIGSCSDEYGMNARGFKHTVRSYYDS